MHHHIVGLEAIHLPYPEFVAPSPHTCTNMSYQTTRPEELHDRIKDATIIIATTVKLDAHTLSPEVTPKLQMVAIMASGTDHVDLDACRKRGIIASNCPHAPTEVVSNHAIGLYFAARRKTVMMHNITTANPSEWKAKRSVVGYVKDASGNAPISVRDEICGIIGYGALGETIRVIFEIDVILNGLRKTNRGSCKSSGHAGLNRGSQEP